MAPTQQLAFRERVANALGISPSSKELSILSTLLGGLSTITVEDASVTIPVPKHLARADVEDTLLRLPALTLSGNARTIIATRGNRPIDPASLSITELKLPPPPSSPPSVHSTEVLPAIIGETLKPKTLDPLVRQRASQLLEALEMTVGEVPNYLAVIGVLEKATRFILRDTKNARSEGCIFMSAEKQEDASALLEGLGFTKASTKDSSLWAGLSYQRICRHSDTKASATIALTARGCEITIDYGQPLSDSRTIIREYSSRASSRPVD